MKIDLTDDQKYLICSSDYPYELQILKRFLTREINDAWILKKKAPHINTERCFINNYGMVPAGLWLEIMRFGKENNIYCELSDKLQNYISQFQFDYDAFKEYVDKLFEGAVNKDNGKPFAPRDYQIKAAYSLLKYRKCCGEISTSAGKTLISFIIFKWLIDNAGSKNVLYIVPNAELAVQSAEKYELYQSFLKDNEKNWNVGILKAGLNKKQKEALESCNILFGTYQSLCKRSSAFFDSFVGCIQDECHHGSANSLLNILGKCNNLKYAVGITGTFPKPDTIDNLTIQCSLGPVIYHLSANDLINKEKSATPIYVVFQMLDWATPAEKQELFFQRNVKASEEGREDIALGNKLLKQEQNFINSSYIRLKYIGDFACKMAKNTLILFGDIKGGYGKRLAEYIKDNSDKNVYYVDGSTPVESREYYNAQCEADETGKTIIVASIGTYKEGVDISNIWSIFLVNSAKSENTVRQICGRGLRNYPGKDKTVLYDFVDDLRYSLDPRKRYYNNYIWNHYLSRKSIYDEQKFPTYDQKISFK